MFVHVNIIDIMYQRQNIGNIYHSWKYIVSKMFSYKSDMLISIIPFGMWKFNNTGHVSAKWIQGLF